MSILRDCLQRIERAADICNLSPRVVDELQEPKLDILTKVRAVTGRGKENFTLVVVLYANPYPTSEANPYKGGLRFKRYPSRKDLVGAAQFLGLDMLIKNTLCMLPFGGAKSILNIDPQRHTEAELESITQRATGELIKRNLMKIYVPGPDYGTNADTMKWIQTEFDDWNERLQLSDSAAVATGKPIEYGGIPGREDATARGALIVFQDIARPQKDFRFAIQGYGNVGKNFFRLLGQKNRWRKGIVTAVTDISGGLFNTHGLPFGKVDAYYKEHGTFSNCPFGDFILPEELWKTKGYDVAVTAAHEGMIDKSAADEITSRWLVEIGNGAVTGEGEKGLEDKKIQVIPDILANPGGVIVSSFEWRKNRGDIAHTVDLAGIETWVYKELTKILNLCVSETLKTKAEFKTNLRMAAHIVALRRLERLLILKHGKF